LQLPPQFKLLGPYTTSLTNPPRHAIAYGAINNDGFFNALCGYVLQVCHAGSQHQTLLSFWASITAEAVAGRIDLAKSGRKEIQRQRQEDLLLKVLPVLKDGLSMHNSSEMVIACFTLAIILASKSQVADKVLDSLMEAVAGALKPTTMDAGLVCLSILTPQKSDQLATSKHDYGRSIKLMASNHLCWQ
jgi:U3 small nucleolar RNA-associated protein 10